MIIVEKLENVKYARFKIDPMIFSTKSEECIVSTHTFIISYVST